MSLNPNAREFKFNPGAVAWSPAGFTAPANPPPVVSAPVVPPPAVTTEEPVETEGILFLF